MSDIVVRVFFAILSLFCIATIFILAGSPVVDTLSEFNPYSLLHIPLFGILAFLLIFSMVPIPRRFREVSNQTEGVSRRLPSEETKGMKARLFIAGGIALVVAILDEFHQLSVPVREGSVSDIVLDLAGIVIVLLLCSWLFKTRISKQTK